MKRASLGVVVAFALGAANMLSACAGDPCPGGHLEGTVLVGGKGVAVQPPTGWGSPRYTPYTETSPVAHCTIVDVIYVEYDGTLRSEDFAGAEEIGIIMGEPPINAYMGELLEGFDQLTHLGDIGLPYAEVSGFNNVTSMGVLGTSGLVTGFNKLESAVALPYTGNTPGLTHLKHLGEFKPSDGMTALELPALEEVEGDLILFGTLLRGEFSLPSLTFVGGDISIQGNGGIVSWGGLANDAHVEGDARFQGNDSISNSEILDWITRSNFSAGGALVVCLNGNEADPPCPP